MEKQRAALRRRAEIMLKSIEGVKDIYKIQEDVVCDLMKEAIELDSLDVVKYLLDKGVDIGIDIEYVIDEMTGRTAFAFAVFGGNLRIATLLVKKGANKEEVLSDGDFIVHLASERKNIRMLAYLIDIGLDVNIVNKALCTPLQGACASGNVDAVECLLYNGADVNFYSKRTDSPLFIATERGYIDIVRLLITYNASIFCEDEEERSPFHAVFSCVRHALIDTMKCHISSIPAEKDKTDILSLLIESEKKDKRDSFFSKYGNNLLYMAVRRGDLEKLKILIYNGVSVKNIGGGDSIFTAARMIGSDNVNRFKIYDLLIMNGADVNEETFFTPLLCAIVDKDITLVKYLLDAGADTSDNCYPSRENEGDRSPSIYIAVKHGYYEIIELLLNRGVDVNFCRNGTRLIDITLRGRTMRPDITTLLLKYGADTSHIKVEDAFVVEAKNKLRKRRFSAIDSDMFTQGEKKIARTVLALKKRETQFSRLPMEIVRELCTHVLQFK